MMREIYAITNTQGLCAKWVREKVDGLCVLVVFRSRVGVGVGREEACVID